jgi:hypothetical protein
MIRKPFNAQPRAMLLKKKQSCQKEGSAPLNPALLTRSLVSHLGTHDTPINLSIRVATNIYRHGSYNFIQLILFLLSPGTCHTK